MLCVCGGGEWGGLLNVVFRLRILYCGVMAKDSGTAFLSMFRDGGGVCMVVDVYTQYCV